jgi:septum formation protein
MELVLASTSPYRRALLARLGLPFAVATPDVDEVPRAGESPAETAARLAQEKASAVAARNPHALVIGSDQVVACDGRRFGKPGTAANAIHQLTALSGRAATFYTAICLVNGHSGRTQAAVEPVTVHFRTLSLASIERYVALDRPLDCAGAFRSEGLGIALVERMTGDDPNALIGLPLIRLVSFLAEEGVSTLAG